MTQRTGHLLNLKGLTIKMVVLALLLGVLLWVLTEDYESRALSETFGTHLTTMLEKQSQLDRLNFDRKVNSFHQVVELTVAQIIA